MRSFPLFSAFFRVRKNRGGNQLAAAIRADDLSVPDLLPLLISLAHDGVQQPAQAVLVIGLGVIKSNSFHIGLLIK